MGGGPGVRGKDVGKCLRVQKTRAGYPGGRTSAI